MVNIGLRISPLKLFFSLSFVCVGALSTILGMVVSRSLTQNMLDRELALTGSFVQSQVREHALYDFFLKPDFALKAGKAKELIAPLQNIPEVVRIKVYNQDGIILWADEPRLIGQRFSDNHELQEALEGKIEVEFKQTRKAENLYEWDRYSTLAEIYVPVFQVDGRKIIGVVELYKYPTALMGQMRKARFIIWAICLAGGAILQGAVFWLFRRSYRLQCRLEEISRHKSEFLANMSHELRTPLNAVIGFAELLRDQRTGPLTEKQTRYLTHIWNSGKHLLQLISDILDLSKVEAGKFTLEPEALPVAATLEDILVIVRGGASKKSQTVEVHVEPDLPPVWADPVRFKQVLFNLLSNAVKFTPDQGRITLVAQREASAREFLRLRVTDTGVGIKAQDFPRIFREFVQLDTTRAQRQEGTGLGLALTKRLVELHGGCITVESGGEGRGSTFTVLLPFAFPATPTPEPLHAVHPPYESSKAEAHPAARSTTEIDRKSVSGKI